MTKIASFLSVLEARSVTNNTYDIPCWDAHLLNEQMLDMLEADCAHTAELIEKEGFYRWSEEHKQSLKIVADSITDFTYALALYYSMMASQNQVCRKGNWIEKGYNKFKNAIKKAFGNNNANTNTAFDNFDVNIAKTNQKGNFGEFKANDNLVNNQNLKESGYDLKSIGRDAPTSPDDALKKGIDGLYENMNSDSNIKYVIDEAKFGSSKLGATNDGLQMSDDWLLGNSTGNNRILDAVNGNEKLAAKIMDALENGEVEKVLTKVTADGSTTTYRLNSAGKIIGTWP